MICFFEHIYFVFLIYFSSRNFVGFIPLDELMKQETA